MTLAIMQPYLFPYIGYWQLINAVDYFIIYDDVNFIKKGYINKNSILIAGESQNFTIELVKASQNKLINEIEIGSNTDKILKTIMRAYKRAPYFEQVYPLIETILRNEEKCLAKFIGFSLENISKYLEIDTKLIYSSDIQKDNRLKGQDKIIEISKKLGANNYINAIGGKELYNKTTFVDENINISFLKSTRIEYLQFKNEFIPNLSILDVIMFNNVQQVRDMLLKYTLI